MPSLLYSTTTPTVSPDRRDLGPEPSGGYRQGNRMPVPRSPRRLGRGRFTRRIISQLSPPACPAAFAWLPAWPAARQKSTRSTPTPPTPTATNGPLHPVLDVQRIRPSRQSRSRSMISGASRSRAFSRPPGRQQFHRRGFPPASLTSNEIDVTPTSACTIPTVALPRLLGKSPHSGGMDRLYLDAHVHQGRPHPITSGNRRPSGAFPEIVAVRSDDGAFGEAGAGMAAVPSQTG